MGVVYFVFVDRRGSFNEKAIELMSYEDYKSLLIEGPQADYYLGRWDYYKEVIEIIKRENVKNTVELGPGYMPIVKNGDVILNPLDDPFGKPNESDSNEYVFDGTITPWPIADKAYDMFIASQVWEHLDGKQTRVFREVMRIAQKAILSFPYHWDGGIIDRPSHRAHRDIDMDLIRDWTLGIEPKLTIEIGRTGSEFSKGPRMICYWDFSD